MEHLHHQVGVRWAGTEIANIHQVCHSCYQVPDWGISSGPKAKHELGRILRLELQREEIQARARFLLVLASASDAWASFIDTEASMSLTT